MSLPRERGGRVYRQVITDYSEICQLFGTQLTDAAAKLGKMGREYQRKTLSGPRIGFSNRLPGQ